jgi:hypothetical protein
MSNSQMSSNAVNNGMTIRCVKDNSLVGGDGLNLEDDEWDGLN